MKQLSCEMCGSVELLKQDSVFVCQCCGCKYTVEEAKKYGNENNIIMFTSTSKITFPGNGIAAMALAHLAGATNEEIAQAMQNFRGVDRRFDFRLKTAQYALLSDYAHHPAEIMQSLRSMRQLYKDRKLTAIFQPHLYTRTRDFYREFAESLSLADEVILTEIYPARELPIEGVSSQLIYDNLKPNVEKTLCRKEEVAALLQRNETEIVIILGAGDLDNYMPLFERILKEKHSKH